MRFEKYSFLLIQMGLIFWISLLPDMINAQNTASIFQIGSPQNESIELLSSNTNGDIVVGGLFDGVFDWDGIALQSMGENDIFIASLPSNTAQWIQSFGSTGQDELLVLTTDNDDNIIACISYVSAIQLGDTLLTPTTGLRGLVLFKMDAFGDLLWVKDWSSTGPQLITDVAVDNQNQMYVLGYFGGTINLDGQAMSAQAEEDLLLVKLSPEGNLIWQRQAGLEGTIRPQALALNETQAWLCVSGIYKGEVGFLADTIQTNTNDFDVFVAQYDVDGVLRWGRKAGGVFEDNNAAVLTDDNGWIYVIGDFQGVLKLDEELQITTNGIQDNNLYILQYDAAGVPQWARSLGGTNFDFVTDATWSNSEQIAICGYFQNSIQIDDFSAQANGNFSGYIVGLSSEDGQAEWLEAIQSMDLVIPNQLCTQGNQLLLGGTFNSSIFYENNTLESAGFFDGFLLTFDESLTPVAPLVFAPSSTVFPNPCHDKLFVQTEMKNPIIRLIDANGQLLMEAKNTKWLDVSNMTEGFYFLEISNTRGKRALLKIVKSQ